MKITWCSLLMGMALCLGVSFAGANESFSLIPTETTSQPTKVEFVSFRNGNLTAPNDCDACATQDNDCDHWRQNLQAWVGGNAFKSFGDSLGPPFGFGFTNSAGILSGLNTSFALGERKVRAQVGGSFGLYDLKGRDFASPSSSEQQAFLTAGIYKRSDIANCDRISWGVVYDQMFDHQYGVAANELYLAQIRGIIGYAWNEQNEFGVWGTANTQSDTIVSTLGGPTLISKVRAANQINSYVRHNYAFGGSTMAYVGLYDAANIGSWSAGMLNLAPLSNNLSLFGNFSMMFPSSKTGAIGAEEQQWNADRLPAAERAYR